MGVDWVAAFIASLAVTVGFAVSGQELAAWGFGIIAAGTFVAVCRRAWHEYRRKKAEEADHAATEAAIAYALSQRVELSNLMGANFGALYDNDARPESEIAHPADAGA